MSYDLYCYRPTSDTPSVEEARSIIESEEDKVYRDDDEAKAIKQKIVAALVEFNPRLEPFTFDHNLIAAGTKVSVEQARARWNHIELNPPEDDLAIQLTVHWDHVSLTTPYWYKGAKADQIFSELTAYLRVIRQTVGFFAYDPQTNRAFDPAKEEFNAHREYDRVVKDLPAIALRAVTGKPWWKFW